MNTSHYVDTLQTDATPSDTSTLSVSEAAQVLGVAKSTLYRSIKEGTCPVRVIKIRAALRFSRVELEAFLRNEAPAAS